MAKVDGRRLTVTRTVAREIKVNARMAPEVFTEISFSLVWKELVKEDDEKSCLGKWRLALDSSPGPAGVSLQWRIR